MPRIGAKIKQNVRATFFVIGTELERNLDQGRKIVAAGYELGNHSYSHERMILHVMYPNRRESMKAVRTIVEALKSHGYSFKTISELLAAGSPR